MQLQTGCRSTLRDLSSAIYVICDAGRLLPTFLTHFSNMGLPSEKPSECLRYIISCTVRASSFLTNWHPLLHQFRFAEIHYYLLLRADRLTTTSEQQGDLA
jgi:hypothetical protein